MNISRIIMSKVLSEEHLTIPQLYNPDSEDFGEGDIDTWEYGDQEIPCNEILATPLLPTGAWCINDGSALEMWLGMPNYRYTDLVLNCELNHTTEKGLYTWINLRASLSTPQEEAMGQTLLSIRVLAASHWLIPLEVKERTNMFCIDTF